MQIVQGQALVTKNGRFIYPQNEEIKPLELTALINYNAQNLVPKYRENMNMYLGKHDILSNPATQTGLNNKLVANLTKYIVDTYNGYFLGIPPKITLDEGDENDKFQQWLTNVSFVDKLAEISKQADVYGRSYGFLYQKENANTGFTYVSPSKSFMIYDDTVEHAPLAFVRYEYLANQSEYQSHGFIYYADKVIEFKAENFIGEEVNPYQLVPATEFFENEEREGVFDSVKTLVNALDKGLSQKANQVEYFDNAYLSIIGLHLPTDKNGNIKMNFKTNRVLYAPQTDPNSSKPDVKFISKPDSDTMQENYLTRLTNLIYQISMVPNLSDINFSGTSSGIALKYKYLSMQMKASEKERKFTKALRQLFQIVFSTGQVLPLQDANDWQNLTFSFTRNVPDDVPGAIDAAKAATGIVSHRTQLKLLPFVSNADDELQQVGKEKADQIKQARASMGDLMDGEKDEQDE